MSDYTREHGVTFILDNGERKHTYNDFGIYPQEKGLPDPPNVRTESIAVPGMDGTLDVSQALDGLVHYEDREFEQTYLVVDPEFRWHHMYSSLVNAIHGRHVRLVFDDDPEWYYDGRMSVGKPEADMAKYIRIPIKGTLKPYKYSNFTSIDGWDWDPIDFESGVARDYKDIEIDGTTTVTVLGSVMPVVPVLTVESVDGDGMTCVYDGVSYHLSDGDNRIPAMSIQAGEIAIVFTGHGTVSIDFREGSL